MTKQSTLLLFAAFLSTAAFAESRPEKVLRLLKANPNMSIEDLEKQMGTGNTIIQSGNSNLVPEAQARRGSRSFDLPAQITRLSVDLVKADKIKIVEGPSLRITVDVIASTGEQTVTELLDGVGISTSANYTQVTSRLSSYNCSIATINGSTSIAGGCFLTVTIELPAGSPVIVSGVKGRLIQLDAAMSADELIRSLKATTFGKDERLRDLLKQQPALMLSPNDVDQILGALNLFDRTDVFPALVARVAKADRLALLPIIDDKISHFDQADARALLSR